MTDNTETSIRLNSSKQPQAPHCAKPEKILPIDWGQTNAEKKRYNESPLVRPPNGHKNLVP